MMKRYILLLIALFIASGCVEPVAKLGCCAKENISDGCYLFNMTDFQFYNYFSDTLECNESSGYCNVTLGDENHLIPICTDTELSECINPNCTAMICGDFKYKPKIAPGVLGTDEPEVDIPPEDEEEESMIGFYKAQCRFLAMDPRLKSVMKNTKASMNVFRIGVGGNFDEYDTYRYYFPLSDKYCNINPSIGLSDIRIDRYMNYLGYDIDTLSPEPYDPSGIGECMDLESPAPEDIFRFGHDSSPDGKYFEVYEYQFAQYYKLLYPGGEEEDVGDGGCPGERVASEYYRKLDREYYRKWLSFANIETIYSAARAPFECSSPIECYSGSCSFDFYSRSANLEIDGDETIEFMADCNPYGTPGGKTIEVCAPTVAFDPVNPDSITHPVNYQSLSVKMAYIELQADGYNSADITQVEELDYPDECPNTHFDQWALGCIGDCGGTGSDNRCELRMEWCDFTGNNLGAYECNRGEENIIDFDNDAQLVSEPFTMTYLPEAIEFMMTPKSQCPLYMPTDDDTEIECPMIVDGKYPPAGGDVFFGKSQEIGKEAKWGGRNVIGYSLSNPRTTLLGEACSPQGPGLAPGQDYVMVEIGDPNGENWQKLMDTFAPVFEERLDDISRGLDGVTSDTEIVISSMPWVIAYKQWDPSTSDYVMSSVAAQKLMERNLFDLPGPNATGTTPAELASYFPHGNKASNKDVSYVLLYPQHIYLYLEPAEEENFGLDCKYDEVLGMPSLKPYGWCEPCTISTIAYQNISAKDWAYLPMTEHKLDVHSTAQQICSCHTYKVSGDTLHTFSCTAPHITDIETYSGAGLFSVSGTPRTQPEVSLMKERLGDYMKAGVLPVIDMTDDSNWDLAPYGTDPFYGTYNEYDFERLFGDMGATVVIVDTVYKHQWIPIPQERLEEISERAAIVKSHCWRCLTAVRYGVDFAPFEEQRFEDALVSTFSDPGLRTNLDVIVFDYSPHLEGYEGDFEDETLEDDVLEDLSGKGRKVLQLTGKPSLAINFYVNAQSSYWTDENLERVLNHLGQNQETLADSGIMGIIWMPARGETDIGGDAIVTYNEHGAGVKGSTFCTVQRGFNEFANPPPTVLYSSLPEVETVNCTLCGSYDKAVGACSRTCDNGGECVLPDGVLNPDDYKCPEGTILSPCRLCNETPGKFVCDYRYYNGTSITMNYTSSYISSDLYMDVIAGMESPEKCCIRNQDGTLISYNTMKFSSAPSVPLVFPKNGAEGASCTMGGLDIASTGFCGVEIVPTASYEVNCTFVPGLPGPIPEPFPEPP